MRGMVPGSTHFMTFREYDLCTSPETGDTGEVGYGRWAELQGVLQSVDCEVCLLLLNILKANRLERMFDSDKRMMAAKMKELLR